MPNNEAILITDDRPRRIWPLLIIALAAAAFFRSMILLNRIPFFSDIRSYYYPGWLYLSQALKSGTLPMWCPGIYCGFPLFADSEMGLAYPVNLMLFRLPAAAGFNYSIVVHYLLGGFFTYLFCRRLRLGRSASVFAAVPFVLGGFFLAHLVHPNAVAAAAWMPLFLYCLERALSERRLSFFVLAGGVAGLQFLAGFLMIPLMELVLAFFYALLYPRGEGCSRWRFLAFSLGGLALAAALGAGLGMVQNLPSYHLVQNSYRAGGLTGKVSNMVSLPPAQLIGLIFPRAFGSGVALGGYSGAWTFEETYGYIGLLPLFFAPAALLRPRRWHALFFLGTAAASLLLTLGNAGLLWPLLRVLPGFSVLKGSGRFLLLFNLGLAVLGGMGFDRWRRGELPRRLPGFLTRFWLAAAAPLAALVGLFVLLYRFDLLGARSFLATVARPLMSGMQSDASDVLRAVYAYFTSPSLEFLVPAFLLTAFLFLIRGWGGGKRPGRVRASLAVVVALFDVLFFAFLIYDLPPRSKAERTPPVVDALVCAEGEGRVALLKEPGVKRGEFPLCPNRLLPYGLDDAFGFSTIPPARLDRFLGRLDSRTRVAAYELLGVTHLFSDLVRVSGQPYDLGMPMPLSGGLRRQGFVYDGLAAEELRLIVDGTFLDRGASGEVYLCLSAVEEDEERLLSVIRLHREVEDGAYGIEYVAGETDIFFRNAFFTSPGHGGRRKALEIWVPAHLSSRTGSVEVTASCDPHLAGTRLLALSAVDGRGNGRPLTALPLVYLDRENAVYATTDPRPRAWFAWEAQWEDSWKEAVDASTRAAGCEGRVILVAEELDAATREKIAGLEPSGPEAEVYGVAEGKDRFSLRSSNPHDAVLVLSIDYLPGWRARVDGRETPLFSAYGFLSAVYLPGGDHEVELTYSQPGLVAGGLITSVTLALAALLFVFARRREKAAERRAAQAGSPFPPPSREGISAFFPCCNDASTLREIVEKALAVLSELAPEYEVIVVDDGSEDESVSVARELESSYPRVRLVRHERNRGYGAALRTGIAASTLPWIFYTDSDGQYDVEELRRLHALSGAADVVNGFKRKRSDPWYRRAMGAAYNLCVRHAFAVPIRDVDCDFRLMRGELARGLDLRCEGGAICVELVKGLQGAGASFAETPVRHYPRRSGSSQFFRLKNVLVMLGELGSLWLRLISRKEA